MLPGDKQFLLRIVLFHLAGFGLIYLFTLVEPYTKAPTPPAPAPSSPVWTVHTSLALAEFAGHPAFGDLNKIPRIDGKFQIGHVTDLSGNTYPLACDGPESTAWLWRDHNGAWKEINPLWDFDLGPRP